jgi:hypothetical protein
MLKKNKIKQNISLYLILIFVFIILIIKIDFFRQLYFLNKNSYDKRMESTYGYCEKDSYGFLMDLKKKYNFEKNPIILNSQVIPLSNWILYDSNKEFDQLPSIFLNYKKKPSLVFKIQNNQYISQDHVQLTDMLESITIITSGKEIILNDKMKISKFDNNKRKIVFEKKIIEKINETKTIPINFETNEFNSRWGNFLIELENLNLIQNKIDTIILNFRNKFSFNEEDIIYKKENCFYVK